MKEGGGVPLSEIGRDLRSAWDVEMKGRRSRKQGWATLWSAKTKTQSSDMVGEEGGGEGRRRGGRRRGGGRRERGTIFFPFFFLKQTLIRGGLEKGFEDYKERTFRFREGRQREREGERE